ncbi:MAG: T9SS type A sorting domain-containing protein, partial [Bacteroidales bacterium]|nr:T9SS type A sorting domain-containing protein [Bacteroidales bacterium]
MIRKIFLVFILFTSVWAAVAQTCTLRFTGTDNQRQHYVKLDHVNIFNKTQLWQEVIYWPDTTLVLDGTGLDEYDIEKGYRIKQNTPNPFSGSTEFAITLPQERSVMIEIFDITGKRVVGKSFGILEAGTHVFNVTLQTPNTYIANATIKDGQMTIKMINEGHGAANEISYAGMRGVSEIKRGKGERYVESYPFAAGDMMEYTGFAVIDGVEYQSAVVEQPQHASATIKLVFTLGVPTVATLGVSNIGN